ncbi:MAG: PhoH family protein [Bacilli bacterium]|nr:PhoH family protein [Bacilli bacterium]
MKNQRNPRNRKQPQRNAEYFEDVFISKPNRRHVEDKELYVPEYLEESVPEKVIPPLRALNEAQGQYLAAQRTYEVVFGVGPAGTGKSYCAVSMACEQLAHREIEKIILTRPMVETGPKVGALPGTLMEKYTPYMMALLSILDERLGKSKAAYYLKHGQIQLLPLEFMRGQTFNDAVVILDEAQNSTQEQMKMFLTRLGKHTRAVVNGDIDQSDVRGVSGLAHAVRILTKVNGLVICTFTEDDIVRNQLIKEIIIAYRNNV